MDSIELRIDGNSGPHFSHLLPNNFRAWQKL